MMAFQLEGGGGKIGKLMKQKKQQVNSGIGEQNIADDKNYERDAGRWGK